MFCVKGRYKRQYIALKRQSFTLYDTRISYFLQGKALRSLEGLRCAVKDSQKILTQKGSCP